jgi:hypothetical protein
MSMGRTVPLKAAKVEMLLSGTAGAVATPALMATTPKELEGAAGVEV